MISTPIAALIGIVTSLFTTIVAFIVQESIRTNRQIGRMILGLSIDCVGTINAFHEEFSALKDWKHNASDGAADLAQDLKSLRELPSGIIVSPPLEFPKELVNLLPSNDARHVFVYYDSWGRFKVLEERYRSLFQNILDRLAGASSDSKKKLEYDVVRAELFEQLDGLVRDLHSTLNELGANCCEILLMARHHAEFTQSFDSISDFTYGRWRSWQEIRDACSKFREAKSCGS
ncbi:MAG: hypothetical protein K8R36_22725 [Planctomycetales bacterium]|nr:hypothetical protein [Planctomycetales bacterium]